MKQPLIKSFCGSFTGSGGAIFSKSAPPDDCLEMGHLFFKEFPGFFQGIEFVSDIGFSVQGYSTVGLHV
jgi:hypothetical protein